jgi:hypothetical protein
MFTKRIDCLDDSWSKRDLATKRNGRPLLVSKTLLTVFDELKTHRSSNSDCEKKTTRNMNSKKGHVTISLCNFSTCASFDVSETRYSFCPSLKHPALAEEFIRQCD